MNKNELEKAVEELFIQHKIPTPNRLLPACWCSDSDPKELFLTRLNTIDLQFSVGQQEIIDNTGRSTGKWCVFKRCVNDGYRK